MSNLTKIESDKNPVAITATWDGVRHWLNAAKMFEQGKLFSQVMTGFELLALQKRNNISQGKRSDLSHDGTSEGWDTILEKEAGLSRSTAYRYMDMAKAAAPRLKKLPALKNFDPTTTAISEMGRITRSELETAVKKLTDGKSQTDFFNELYKQPSGNANPTSAPHKKLTLSEEAAAHQEMARVQWAAIDKQLGVYRDKFTVLTDSDGEAQIAILEQALNARRAWLKQPANNRQPKAIEAMFKGGAQ